MTIRSFVISAILLASSLTAWADKAPKTAILVDKKTNNLHVCEYVNGEFKIIKTFHATLGQVKGDKEEEGDLKTPEGVYVFTRKAVPPALRPKYGIMSFHVSFPNTFDELAGRTGSNIKLHATNEPDRLSKNYDSEGCVVVRNEEITEIAPYIRLGLTPILIFSELTPDFMKPGQDPKIQKFFETWVSDWENKNLDGYMSHYHTDFAEPHKGKTKDGYRAYKAALNARYASIEVKPEDVHYFRHPKYTMITFTQNYRSKLKSGAWGHVSRGTKILYVAEEAGEPKIIAESFSNLAW